MSSNPRSPRIEASQSIRPRRRLGTAAELVRDFPRPLPRTSPPILIAPARDRRRRSAASRPQSRSASAPTAGRRAGDASAVEQLAQARQVIAHAAVARDPLLDLADAVQDRRVVATAEDGADLARARARSARAAGTSPPAARTRAPAAGAASRDRATVTSKCWQTAFRMRSGDEAGRCSSESSCSDERAERSVIARAGEPAARDHRRERALELAHVAGRQLGEEVDDVVGQRRRRAPPPSRRRARGACRRSGARRSTRIRAGEPREQARLEVQALAGRRSSPRRRRACRDRTRR